MVRTRSLQGLAGIAAGALALFAVPGAVRPAQAVPLCATGPGCRSALVAAAGDLRAALEAGASERDRRSPANDIAAALRSLEVEAPAREAVAYCTGAAKEDDRGVKKLARAAKSCEKLVARQVAGPDVATATAALVDEIIAAAAGSADEVEGILGATAQTATARERLAQAADFRGAMLLAKAADSAQRAYNSIRSAACDSSIRSCTTGFDAAEIDEGESTDWQLDASPDATECSIVRQVNGTTVNTEVTTCEDATETLDYDYFVDTWGMVPGDVFTIRILRTNATEACSASVALVGP